jgi:hypothetical protein
MDRRYYVYPEGLPESLFRGTKKETLAWLREHKELSPITTQIYMSELSDMVSMEDFLILFEGDSCDP